MLHTLFTMSIVAAAFFVVMPMMSFADSAQTKNDTFSTAEPTSKAWIQLLDKEKYGEAWEQSSSLMKAMMDKDGWDSVMDHMRKPLGKVESREVVDQRSATNPKGLQDGEYAVRFYKTEFANKKEASELVTLYYENGQWRVMTYQVH